jgi:hypothetical protein
MDALMFGSTNVDPSKLGAAKDAYFKNLAETEPGLINNKGQSEAVDPFVTYGDGTTEFNRWIDAENRLSAQNQWFDDKEKTKDGKTKTVRRPMWQAYPEYVNDEARGQFDYITFALNKLQRQGSKDMLKIFNKGMHNVNA